MKKILAIGAHPDDIESFCGGTLLKLKSEGSKIHSLVCTIGENKKGDRLEENDKACVFLRMEEWYVWDFKDSYLEHNKKLVKVIDDAIKKVKPDWIFTHSVNDYHQDHVAVAKATLSANRKQGAALITYPSYNLTIPFDANLFVDIDDFFDKKLELLKIFKSQKDEWYMQPEHIGARSKGTNIAKYIERFKIEMMRL